MTSQIIICAGCGEERRRAGKGMCSACYERTRPKITCADCGKEQRPGKYLPEGVLCSNCWRWRNAVACSVCGAVKPRANGGGVQPLCAACWTAARPPVTCSACGRTRPPGGVTAYGQLLCKRCGNQRRSPVTCAGCGQLKPPHNRTPDGTGHLCSSCADKQRPDEKCGGCGRMTAVVARESDGTARCDRCWTAGRREPCAECGKQRRPAYRLPDQSALCRPCGRRRGPQEPCGTCGKTGWHESRDMAGARMCTGCRQAHRLPCSRCGTDTYVALRWPSGPVCADCVDQALAEPGPCSRCGTSRPDVAGPGTPACCPECADLWFGYQCTDCGQFTRPLRRGQCARCQVTAALAAAAPDGVPAALEPLLDEMLWDDPDRGIRWLRDSTVARLLLSLLAVPEVTHEALDAAAAAGMAGRRAAERLRGLLAASGALPYRDTGLGHYEDRVAEIVSAVPAASQMAVRRYARWAVTRPLQERAAGGEAPSADLARWPLARIRAAAQFTAGLAEAGQSLGTVTQSHLDAWTAEIPGSAPVLRGFVNWASAHGYMAGDLEIPWRNSRENRRSMDDVERLALAGHLLRTQEGSPRDRLGAILVLLFGQHATRVARLKASAVSLDSDGRVHIALGDTPVRLREPLAHLAITVADDARRTGSPWLFPGENGPMSSDRFRERLGKVGVSSVQMARNSALASFAADVPPALLADKLGLSISAAVSWSKAVGAARADYAGLRSGPPARSDGQALPLVFPARPSSCLCGLGGGCFRDGGRLGAYDAAVRVRRGDDGRGNAVRLGGARWRRESRRGLAGIRGIARREDVRRRDGSHPGGIRRRDPGRPGGARRRGRQHQLTAPGQAISHCPSRAALRARRCPPGGGSSGPCRPPVPAGLAGCLADVSRGG